MNLDARTTEALARVRRSEPAFSEWLERKYVEYSKTIMLAQSPDLQWIQGRMQELRLILDTLESATKSV